MQKITGLRAAVMGLVLVGLFAFAFGAAAPTQAALPGAPAVQVTDVPPVVQPTVVVIPTTGEPVTTTGWLIPVLIIVGVALVVLFAVAIAGSRSSNTDV